MAAALLLLSGCGGGSGASTSRNSGPLATSSTPSATNASSGGTATLAWSAPTSNTNGSALTDLAGYHIHYGTNASSLSNTINIPSAGSVSYVVTGLTAGTWYFAISAYTNSGLESAISNVGSKTIS